LNCTVNEIGVTGWRETVGAIRQTPSRDLRG